MQLKTETFSSTKVTAVHVLRSFITELFFHHNVSADRASVILVSLVVFWPSSCMVSIVLIWGVRETALVTMKYTVRDN